MPELGYKSQVNLPPEPGLLASVSSSLSNHNSLNLSHPSLEFSYLALCYLEVFCLTYRQQQQQQPGVFQVFFCLIPLWSQSIYDFLKYFLMYVIWPQMLSILVNIPYKLTRIYIPLLLGKVVYRCQLHPVDQWCYWVLLRPSGFLPARSIHFW